MNKFFALSLRKLMIFPVTLLTMNTGMTITLAQTNLYNPIPLVNFGEITDTLSSKDIPTGQGGFGRDYSVKVNKGDNLLIDLSSDNFDTVVTLLGPDGATVGENDDASDGSSNSQLFTRITETGTYIIRVHSFGETGVGKFIMKVTKLQEAK